MKHQLGIWVGNEENPTSIRIAGVRDITSTWNPAIIRITDVRDINLTWKPLNTKKV